MARTKRAYDHYHFHYHDDDTGHTHAHHHDGELVSPYQHRRNGQHGGHGSSIFDHAMGDTPRPTSDMK